MIDYTKVITNNEYVNHTIGHYVSCYEKLSESSIKTLGTLFDKLKSYELAKSNAIIDHHINYGLRLQESEKEAKQLIKTQNAEQTLQELSHELNPNNVKEMLFFTSVTRLVEASSCLSSDELYYLNEFFDQVEMFNYDISEPIDTKYGLFYKKTPKSK